MSHYRVNPVRIRVADTTSRKKGGQGVVIAGTLSLPAVVKSLVLHLKSVTETFKVSPEEFEERLPQLKEGIKIWPPEMPVATMVEMVRMPYKALEEWLPEMKVAVKMLKWNHGNVAESTKFFKVCSSLPLPPPAPV